MRTLDKLRAPLTEDEHRRRSVARLTPSQRYYLEAWGYPYVIDEFRLHFTLTNAVPDSTRFVKTLEQDFSLRVASRAMRVDAVILLGETTPDGEFRIVRSFTLDAPNARDGYLPGSRLRRSSTDGVVSRGLPST